MIIKKIKDILTTEVIPVSPEISVSDGISTMTKNRISSLLIIENKDLVGILTERDIVRCAHRKNEFCNIMLKEIMSKPVLTVGIDQSVYEVYDILKTNKIRHLVVLDANGLIAGVITQTNIINNIGLEVYLDFKTISRLMTKKILTTERDSFVLAAVSKMAANVTSCIVVVKDKYPVGILTERDVSRLLMNRENIENTRIENVMSFPVRTINENTPVHDVVNIMKQESIRRLLIVDKKSRLMGIVTQSDIVNALEWKYIEFLKEVIEKKDKQLKETKNDLTEKKVYLDSILCSSKNLAIIATDLAFRIKYYNQLAKDIFSGRLKEIIGITLNDLYTDNNLNISFLERIVKKVEENKDYEFTFKVKHYEVYMHIQARIFGIWRQDDKLEGFVLMARDITENFMAREQMKKLSSLEKYQNHLEDQVQKRTVELKSTQDRLIHSEKLSAIGKLSASIAHEFNNPIYGIRNVLEEIEEKHTGETLNDLDKKLVKLAIKECNRMSNLISKLQDFHQPSLGIDVSINLHEIIDEVVLMIRKRLNDRNILLEMHYADNIPKIKAVPDQIKQVVLNLVQNAEEAIVKEGGKIVITTEFNKSEVLLHLKDSGMGITSENIGNIFEPFFTTKSPVKDTGLGLSVSYGIIKKHGGDIKVQSKLGEGTTFTIILPVNGEVL